MILRPYYLACLSHASYLVGDEETGTAVVIDPQRDVDQYLRDAASLGLEIRHVILTHFHADFVSGHLELRERCGARIHLGARAKAQYAFEPARDGSVLEVGKVRFRFLETPGHTPEGISALLFDLSKSAKEPHAVFTGDTLFIGDVGRPDLMASVGVTAAELADMLYGSLHRKLLALPDGTLVYPAHGAGSMCGKNLSQERVSTIGEQRRSNYALQPMDKAAFVRLVTSEQPEAPAYFSYDAQLNREERPTLEQALERALRPLAIDAVRRMQEKGAQILDVRDPAVYAAGHLAGSVNIGLGGRYAQWAGTVLDRTKPIVIVADPGREVEAAMRLGRIGFDQVAGFLEGGSKAFAADSGLVRRHERTRAESLAARLASTVPPLVLDVRTDAEWRGARIEGSLNVPLPRLRERVGEIPRDRPVIVHCQSGYRSSVAASLLEGMGRPVAGDLEGGILAWQAASLATVSAR